MNNSEIICLLNSLLSQIEFDLRLTLFCLRLPPFLQLVNLAGEVDERLLELQQLRIEHESLGHHRQLRLDGSHVIAQITQKSLRQFERRVVFRQLRENQGGQGLRPSALCPALCNALRC